MTSRSKADARRRGGFLRRAARQARTARKHAEPGSCELTEREDRGYVGLSSGWLQANVGHSGGAVPRRFIGLLTLDHPSSARRPASAIRI
jgi:hypothetical protein